MRRRWPDPWRTADVVDAGISAAAPLRMNACRVAADRRHSLVEFLLAAASNEHICAALIGEELCCSLPDALLATGDNCHFPL